MHVRALLLLMMTFGLSVVAAQESPEVTPGGTLAAVVQGEIVYDDGETVVIRSRLGSYQVEEVLDGLAVPGGLQIDVRVETTDHNVYFTANGRELVYQRSTDRQGTPGRVASSTPVRGPGFVCESNSWTRGSSMRCYDDGRLVYRSRCRTTNGRVSCTSRTY